MESEYNYVDHNFVFFLLYLHVLPTYTLSVLSIMRTKGSGLKLKRECKWIHTKQRLARFGPFSCRYVLFGPFSCSYVFKRNVKTLHASGTHFNKIGIEFPISSIGRVFRSLVRWRWKMAALPLPVAILDDLISGSRKWGHPRWRPEAEGPPFSTSTSLGIEKRAPGPGWRHFRPRQLGSKMATAEMMSGGRRDAREDVLQTSAPSMSPVEVWLYWKHLIVSLTQALSKWLSELPACYYAEVISLHMSKVV